MLDVSSYRALFPITQRCVYLDHAGVSPLNLRAVEAMRVFNDWTAREPFGAGYLDVLNTLNRLRTNLARLINARSVDEIVLLPNTAVGVNTAAVSLPLGPGDNVLVVDGDYPANIYPWMNLTHRGVLTKIVPQRHGGLDLDLLRARIDSRTRAIAVSTVMFATGFRNDIEAVGELCRERGMFFVVDGIQSIGALPLDVQAAQVDFLACGSQKWLLGPIGIGFLYVRRELMDDLAPGAHVGAGGVVAAENFLDYNFTPLPTAERFNIGSQNFAGAVGLAASVELPCEIGVERIAESILALTALAIEECRAWGLRVSAGDKESRRSGIVIVEVDDPVRVSLRLKEEGIYCIPRGKGIRVAPHFYNTEDEIRRACQAIGASIS